jgi:hypothetical protein
VLAAATGKSSDFPSIAFIAGMTGINFRAGPPSGGPASY